MNNPPPESSGGRAVVVARINDPLPQPVVPNLVPVAVVQARDAPVNLPVGQQDIVAGQQANLIVFGPHLPDTGRETVFVPLNDGFQIVANQYDIHEAVPNFAQLSGRELRNVVLREWKHYPLPTLRRFGYLRQPVVYDWYAKQIGLVNRDSDVQVLLPETIVESLCAWALYRPHTQQTFLLLVAKLTEVMRVVAMEAREESRVCLQLPLVVWYRVMRQEVQDSHRLATGEYDSFWQRACRFLLDHRVVVGFVGLSILIWTFSGRDKIKPHVVPKILGPFRRAHLFVR